MHFAETECMCTQAIERPHVTTCLYWQQGKPLSIHYCLRLFRLLAVVLLKALVEVAKRIQRAGTATTRRQCIFQSAYTDLTSMSKNAAAAIPSTAYIRSTPPDGTLHGTFQHPTHINQRLKKALQTRLAGQLLCHYHTCSWAQLHASCVCRTVV